MRRVLAGDVAAAARVLHALPERHWRARLARLLAAAETADRYRARTGATHPVWGTGSLAAASHGMERSPEPDFDDDRYCRCWIAVLQAVMAHRAGGDVAAHPDAQEMQSGTVGSCASRPSAISSPHSRHSP
jgi:hypothetical protein